MASNLHSKSGHSLQRLALACALAMISGGAFAQAFSDAANSRSGYTNANLSPAQD